jgi:hypothetical protein
MTPDELSAYESVKKSINEVVDVQLRPLMGRLDDMELQGKKEVVFKRLKELDNQMSKIKENAEKRMAEAEAKRKSEEDVYQKKLKGFERTLRTKATDMEEKLRSHFGETDDPYTAGWILSDGTMISMSYQGRSRDIDHRMIGEAFEEDRKYQMFPGGTDGMYMFMNATGACRMHWTKNSAFFDFKRNPTVYQIVCIKKIIRNVEYRIGVDITIKSKTTSFDLPYEYEDLMREIGGSQFL